MSKKYQSPSISEEDIRRAMSALEKDYGAWGVKIGVKEAAYYPFEVQVECYTDGDLMSRLHVSDRFYTTTRYPNLMDAIWKALHNLYVRVGRDLDGLAQLPPT